ncbi:unnamed protein product, partial [Iphiclides podalirius]
MRDLENDKHKQFYCSVCPLILYVNHTEPVCLRVSVIETLSPTPIRCVRAGQRDTDDGAWRPSQLCRSSRICNSAIGALGRRAEGAAICDPSPICLRASRPYCYNGALMMISAFGLLLLVAVTVDSSSTPAANLQPMTANSRAQYVFENPVSVTTEGELREWSPHPAETKTAMADHENNVRSERVTDVPIEISTLANYEDADSAPGSHCPKGCDCIELTDGTSYNCSLPSGVVAFDEFGDGIIFKCLSGTLRCSEVPSGGGSAGAFAANATVRSVSLQGCALPEEPVLCALRRRGATSAQRLTLKRPLTPLSAEHVRGLGALTMLRITDLDGEEARLPLAAIASLPLLQHLTLDNAHLILREELPSLPLRALELADDALQTLPHAPFRHLQQLRRLGLWHNRFEQLPADALQGLGSLQELSFSSNRLATLPGTLLASTPQLRNLDLYDNELRFLPRSLFAGLAFLEQVRLNDNRGELTLEEGTFSGLTSLTELELSRSGLRSLPADTFRGCSVLKRLLLSGNSLASLPDKLLRGLPALAHLDLSRNELSAIPPSLFADQQNLVELYLDHNSFETLTSSMFLGLSNLELLSLSHNKLRLIAYDAFTTLRSLLRLNLAHNELSFGDDGTGGVNGADGAEGYLLLGGPPSPFNGMTLLTNLDLSHNRVHQMLDDWRIVLTALKRLNLSWNNFSQFDYVSMSFLGSNVVVDLRNNNISTVDLQGDSNGSAVILLDGNPFACDCHAPALQEALAAGVAPPAPAPLPPRPRLVAPSATCAEPPHLRGLSLLEAPRSQLRCSLPSPQCPSDCSCFLLPDHLALDCDTLPPRLPSPIDHQLTITHLRLHNVTGSLPSLPAHVRRLDLSKLNITQCPSCHRTSRSTLPAII